MRWCLRITSYTDSSVNGPDGIAAGPDGALWFGNCFGNTIDRLTTLGRFTTFSSSTLDCPDNLTLGPDGALWFVNNFTPGSIGRISTSGTVTSYTSSGLDGPVDIASSGGALWVTSFDNSVIARCSTTGRITTYTTTGMDEPEAIAAGPDGNAWFLNRANDRETFSVGRITPHGTITLYNDASIRYPLGITAGPDGAMWFTNEGTEDVDRVTTGVTPAINKVLPASGPVGTSVTIDGANLAGATAVDFNGTPASIDSATATAITTHVPAGATTGHITVTTADGVATSKKVFTVTASG